MKVESTSAAPDKHDTSLSEREVEVLEGASRGLTNGEIAQQMNVTIHAVKWHLASVYRKLGVNNRTAAAITYLKDTSDALAASEG